MRRKACTIGLPHTGETFEHHCRSLLLFRHYYRVHTEYGSMYSERSRYPCMLLRTIRFRLLLRLIQCAVRRPAKEEGVVGKYCRGNKEAKNEREPEKVTGTTTPYSMVRSAHVAKNTQDPKGPPRPQSRPSLFLTSVSTPSSHHHHYHHHSSHHPTSSTPGTVKTSMQAKLS